MGELTAGIFYQLLKRCTLTGEPALQRASAQSQLAGHSFQGWAPPGEQLFENPFHLTADGLVSQLPGQFGLELRRDDGQQIGVVRHKGPFDVSPIEDKSVLPSAESYWAPEVRLVYFAVCRGPLEFHAPGIHGTAGAATPDPEDPGEANINQQTGLFPRRQQPEELDRAFIPAFGDADLFRAGELFVARHALQSISK